MYYAALTQTFSARFFAAVTIVSLLLSALPASFFVAYAARTGVDVTAVAGTTADVGVNIRFVAEVLDDGDDTDTASIILSDGGQGGIFTDANDAGCTGDLGTGPQSRTVASGSSNKRFCYRNATAGSYDITVQAQVVSVDVGTPDVISVTVNDVPAPVTPEITLDAFSASPYVAGTEVPISGTITVDSAEGKNAYVSLYEGAECGGLSQSFAVADANLFNAASGVAPDFTYATTFTAPATPGMYSMVANLWSLSPSSVPLDSSNSCLSFEVVAAETEEPPVEEENGGGGNNGGGDKKVTICHATASESNPYVAQEVSEASILNPGGHGNSGINEGDIIPPFGDYSGQNWTTEFIAIYENECNVPDEVEESFMVPLTLCKHDAFENPLAGWTITVSNGETELDFVTEENGCATTEVNAYAGPWTVLEEDRAGWEQVEVSTSGPGSMVDMFKTEQGGMEGCLFSRPLVEEALESSETGLTAVAEQALNVVVAPPSWSCDFYNQPIPTTPITMCKLDGLEQPVVGWKMDLYTAENEVPTTYQTLEDGCVTVDVPESDLPAYVYEEEREDWTPVDAWAYGARAEMMTSYAEVEGGTDSYYCVVGGENYSEYVKLSAVLEDEVRGATCTFMNEHEPEDPGVPNTCLIPNTLGDTDVITILDSGEKSIAAMMAEDGYTIDVIADETNIQVWDVADPTAETITFNLRVVGKRAGNTQVLGYYKAGDGATYSAVLTQVSDTDGEVSIPVTIPAAFASSFGFAIQSGGKTWYSEKGLNDDDLDHAAVYNPVANTYLLAFEDFDGLGDSDYNDLVIEISDVTCVPPREDEDDTPVVNQCVLPDSLGDESIFEIGTSVEKTIAEMMAEHGYTVDPIADQMNYQVWNVVDPGTDSVSFDIKVLGKRAGNTQVLGYYKAGDSLTFTSVLTQVSDTDGEVSIPVTIPAAFASSFGFAIQSGDFTWYSETALNSDGLDHVAVYNPAANTYLLAFEDTDGLGDADYNDLVIAFSQVACEATPDNSGGDSEIETTSTRTSSSGGRSLRRTTPAPLVLGESTSLPDAPVGQVLGEQVSAVPFGAPNAGAGSTSTAGLTLMNIMFVSRARQTMTRVK